MEHSVESEIYESSAVKYIPSDPFSVDVPAEFETDLVFHFPIEFEEELEE